MRSGHENIHFHALFFNFDTLNPIKQPCVFQQLRYICALTITKNIDKLIYIAMFLNNLGLLK